MRILLFTILWIFLLPAFAQKQGNDAVPAGPSWPACRSSFERVALPGIEPETEVKAWFGKENGRSLTLTAYRQSPGGKHLAFEQVWEGVPVFHSQVKVNLDHSGHITSVFDNSVSTAGWARAGLAEALARLPEQQTIDRLPVLVPGFVKVEQHRKAIFAHPDSSLPHAVVEAEVLRQDGALLKLVIDANGNILWQEDLRSFHTLMTDTTAKGNIFLPDPLTTALRYYGGQYRNFDDADVPELNAELVERTFTATFRQGAFRLERPWLVMVDREEPFDPVPFRLDGDFRTTRGQTDFEYVNAYYHLTHYHNYLVGLGFTGLFSSGSIEVDPRGDTSDNSFFTPGTPSFIVFGIGGVDDAEDADVIIHEFGHAISHNLSPGTNSGTERKALDEGFGDYLAASYSRSISEFRWDEIFTWDGHNEFWAGRLAATNKTYPIDASSNIYMTGEIWSSALMEIWEELGRETTDMLAVQAMFGTSINMGLRDAARLMLQAEDALFGGQYYDIVYQILLARGLLEPFTTQVAGSDNFLRGRGELAVYLGPEIAEGTVEIFDLQGRLVASRVLDRRVTSLPRNWFPSYGMYLVRISGGHQPIVQKAVYIGWP